MRAVLLLYLLLLSYWDLRKKTVPAAGLVVGALLTVGWCLLSGMGDVSYLLAISAGILPGAGILLMAGLTGKVGFADGWVLLLLGALLGSREVLLLLCVSLLLLSAVSIVLLAFRRVNRNTRLPYLPCLALSYLGSIAFRL